MAIQDKNTLKSYFETGDKPTQQQFTDLIDSFKHESDMSGEFIWLDCADTLTSADKNKAVMMGSDGKLKLYEVTPPFAGVKGKWTIIVNNITIPNNNYPSISYNANGNGMWADTNNWRNEEPTSTDDEANMIASYISTNHSDLLSAISSGNAVTIEEVNPLGGSLEVKDVEGVFNFSTVVNPESSQTEKTDNFFIGLIKEVNETLHKCILFSQGIVEGIAAEDIDVVSILGNVSTLEDNMQLIVLPTNGGLVRLATQNDFANVKGFPMSLLGSIGFAMSNALTGEKVIIKQLK